ncbi:MAG: undecaprenyl-diphosphate phosphatase [Bacteroidaceae bacterium]|nr:undecaprenyl-diphosphate phosphatase [Bacteroidaceae bacterium]
MDWLHALILGLVQGLTEYLPISSSGHLELGKVLLGTQEAGLEFDVLVHVATVLSTLIILWKEVAWIFRGLFMPLRPKLVGEGFLSRLSEEQRYAFNILLSMIPVGIVGLCFKDVIAGLYEGDEHLKVMLVGCFLIVTALLLAFSYFAKPRPKDKISPMHAFIIGVAQACAVLPGLSRSGSTIATGLLLGNKKEKLAQFSFLMVIPPILGEALLDVRHILSPDAEHTAELAAQQMDTLPMVVGFVAAFVSGCFACKWMLDIVKKGKLIYFAIYCALVGAALLIFA